MEQVFISHSTKDRRFVETELISLLRDHELVPWYAADDVPTAARWEHEILKALHASRWFMVVLTPEAVKSQWVRAEVHWAVENRRRRIVPVLLRECDVASLSLQLPGYQHVDYRADLLGARKRLLSVWGASVAAGRTLQVRLSVEYPHAQGVGSGKIEPISVLVEESCIIGRRRSAGIPLTTPTVSRDHAVLKVRETPDGTRSLWLGDLGASNGTFCNGQRVREMVELDVGDTIRVGTGKLGVDAISYPGRCLPADAGDDGQSA